MSTPRRPEVERLQQAMLAQAREHAMLLYGADQRIVWASDGAERIFGATAAQLVGRHTAELFVQEDIDRGIPDLEFEIARRHGSSEDDRWTRRPDGSRFWSIGHAYALRDEAGEVIGYAKVLQNRTDWWQQQETYKNRAAELAKLDAQKNLLISTLAHELRSPLAPMLNAAHLLRRGQPVGHSVGLIERQISVIERLVSELLDATLARAGKVQLQLEPVLLQDVFDDVVEAVSPRIEERRHRLDVMLPPTPVRLDADPLRLRQIFSNLLANAAKYTPEGGRIWLKATVEDGEAVVRVEDDGIGIAPDMLGHIFELFVQAEPPSGAELEGLGIGLSLVKELVTLHGGTVQAASDGPGLGSDFIVRLPRRAD